LELVEGAFQHVLRVDLFNSQQVQHHVVGEVERTVQRVCTTLGVCICVCGVEGEGEGEGGGGLYICATVVVICFVDMWTCVTIKMYTCTYGCTCSVVHAVYIHTYTDTQCIRMECVTPAIGTCDYIDIPSEVPFQRWSPSSRPP